MKKPHSLKDRNLGASLCRYRRIATTDLLLTVGVSLYYQMPKEWWYKETLEMQNSVCDFVCTFARSQPATQTSVRRSFFGDSGVLMPICVCPGRIARSMYSSSSSSSASHRVTKDGSRLQAVVVEAWVNRTPGKKKAMMQLARIWRSRPVQLRMQQKTRTQPNPKSMNNPHFVSKSSSLNACSSRKGLGGDHREPSTGVSRSLGKNK